MTSAQCTSGKEKNDGGARWSRVGVAMPIERLCQPPGKNFAKPQRYRVSGDANCLAENCLELPCQNSAQAKRTKKANAQVNRQKCGAFLSALNRQLARGAKAGRVSGLGLKT